MDFLNSLYSRAKNLNKTIILPETMDRRVLEAGIKAQNEDIANIIFIGNKETVINDNKDLDFNNVVFIDPLSDDNFNYYKNKLYELRKDKGMTLEEAEDLLKNDYMYYACMMVHEKKADGVVSGACHTTSNTLRPALQIIKTKETSDLVSAFFLMIVPDSKYGYNGIFVFGDAGLIQNPTSNELASIASSSAKSFELITGQPSVVAFLSHSTYSSAKHELVDKVKNAVIITKEKYPEINCDGELQVDAAIDIDVAKIKAPTSKVAGHANTLIFPNLDAGNIGYKLVEKLANASSYGPITQGINKPINDLSRGCSVTDIIGVIAITCIQSEQ